MALRTSLTAALLALAALPAAAHAGIPTIAPDVTKLTVTPAKFKALTTGGPVVQAGGAKVTFTTVDSTNVNFTVKAEKPGKRAGSSCVAGKPKKKGKACVRTVDVPGGFKLITLSGPNEFQFSGRIGTTPLAPGAYRLVAKADGQAARSSYARFTILK